MAWPKNPIMSAILFFNAGKEQKGRKGKGQLNILLFYHIRIAIFRLGAVFPGSGAVFPGSGAMFPGPEVIARLALAVRLYLLEYSKL